MKFLIKKYGNLNISILKNYPSVLMKRNSKGHLKNITGINKDRKIFLYQGVLQYGRGIISMINLLKHFDVADAVIIGDGDYKKEIINFVEKNNLQDRVYFIKSVSYSELFKYTCGADIGFSLIKPISFAYFASMGSPVNNIFIVFFLLTFLLTATIGVLQNKPMFTPGVANIASSELISKSQLATN